MVNGLQEYFQELRGHGMQFLYRTEENVVLAANQSVEKKTIVKKLRIGINIQYIRSYLLTLISMEGFRIWKSSSPAHVCPVSWTVHME